MLVGTLRKIKRVIDFLSVIFANRETDLWMKIVDMRLNHEQHDLVPIARRFVDFSNLVDPAYPLNWDYLEGRTLFSQDRLNAVSAWMLKRNPDEGGLCRIDDLHRQVADRIGLKEKERKDLPQKERYLVIRACGIGFWGEINHVISQLVFASWTRRTPCVFWGDECFYHDGSQGNAFMQFFAPWDDDRQSKIKDMSSFFPDDFWTRETVFGRNTRMYSSKSSRSYVGLDVLGRDDEVLVVDSYVALDVLLEWLPQGNEYGGLTIREAYRNIFGRYLRLLPEISDRIEEFWDRTMKGIPFVAVHARGGDRTESKEKLADNDRRYFEKIEAMCPSGEAIFLCTDSEFIYEDFRSRYKDRLVTYPSQRTAGNQGLHTAGSPANRRLAGMETLVEVLLSARCSKFIGCSSNVSGAIDTMGDWEDSYLFRDLPSLTL